MKKPVILITGGPAVDIRHKLDSKMLNKTYPNAVYNAGGVPIMDIDDSSQDDYVELCDGVIFSGAQQFAPNDSFKLEQRQKERKRVENELMKKFLQKGKPIFAICQGMQMLNVALGGDLRQQHRQKHQAAAKIFTRQHRFVVNQHACQHAKYRFEAEKQRHDGWVGPLLRHDLQRIRHAAGKYAHIQHGPQEGTCQLPRHRFKEQRAERRPDGDDKKLHAG